MSFRELAPTVSVELSSNFVCRPRRQFQIQKKISHTRERDQIAWPGTQYRALQRSRMGFDFSSLSAHLTVVVLRRDRSKSR